MKSFFESRILSLSLFLIYLAVLIWIIVFKFNIQFSYMSEEPSANWIPFSQPTMHNGRPDHNESILNVLIFFPFGLYLRLLGKKWGFLKATSIFFLSSLALELSQFLLKIGAFDSTDILTNTLGGCIGWLFYNVLEQSFQDKIKVKCWVNAFCLIGTLLFLGLFIFLKVNRLYMFRM